ncbi:MAG: carboxymuconolactone decarboxylase family protein [Chloroflexota bacterium]
MARVPYVARENLPESDRHIYDEIAGKRGRANAGNNFEALLNSPQAASKVSDLGAYLRYESELPGMVRELIILTVATELNCEYEWAEHESSARKAGITDATIAAIRERRAPQALPPDEANIVRYVHELLRTRHVSDATFKTMLGQLGTKLLVEATIVVGYYTMLALTFLALNIEH